MNDEELISVIVPVYNVEKYLRRCMDSIVQQTYKNIEIIIVDDGSIDSSGKISDEYAKKDKRIKVIHKQNGGLSDARNVALDIIKGKYIAFIDSDDSISNDYIEYLYNLLKKNNADMGICDSQVCYNDLIQVNNEPENIIVYSKDEVIKEMLYANHYFISAWGKIYKKELLNNVRYPKGQIYEDINTTYLIYLSSNKIACSNQRKYYYYLHPNSITTSKFDSKHFELIKATDVMTTDLEKKYPELKMAIMRRRVYSRLSVLCKMINSNYQGKEKKEVIGYIQKYGRDVLKDALAPKRDKISIFIIIYLENCFGFVWKVYTKFTGRNKVI